MIPLEAMYLLGLSLRAQEMAHRRIVALQKERAAWIRPIETLGDFVEAFVAAAVARALAPLGDFVAEAFGQGFRQNPQ